MEPGFLSPREQQIWNVTFGTVYAMNGGFIVSVAKDAADGAVTAFRRLKLKDANTGTYVQPKEKER